MTSREAYEIATRFFFGDVLARLRLAKANVTRGGDWFGQSEFFFGVSIKPRQVDFELFHQSAEAENCYGPFRNRDLTDSDVSFNWANPDTRLIWEGSLDTSKLIEDPERGGVKDMVLRLDCYVGERDTHGLGFSDNVIFRKQYYLRAIFNRKPFALYRHADERFMGKNYVLSDDDKMRETPGGWEFDVTGTGFTATFEIQLAHVPEDGAPFPLRQYLASATPATAGSEKSAMPKPAGETGPPGA